MENSTFTKLNRKLAGIMAIMMLFVMLFSAVFIASHLDHDCTGDDCPICECICQCENLLHGSWDGSAFSAAGILPAVLITISIFISYCVTIFDTPVSEKVRMNN